MLQAGWMSEKVLNGESDTGYAYSTAISADGEYLVDRWYCRQQKFIYLIKIIVHHFGIIDFGDIVNAVDISANGEYIVAGSRDDKIYLFNKNSSNTNLELFLRSNRDFTFYFSRWRIYSCRFYPYVISNFIYSTKILVLPFWSYDVPDFTNLVS